MTTHRVSVALSLLFASIFAATAAAQVDPNGPGVAWPATAPRPLPDYDARHAEVEANVVVRTRTEVSARAADAASLKAGIPMLRIDDDSLFGTPRWVASTRRFLTAPVESGLFDPTAVVRGFVAAHRGLFEIAEEEIDLARRSRDYATNDVGTRHLTFQQQIGGIDLFGAKLRANVTRRGEIVNVSSTMLPRPEGDFAPAAVRMTAARAIRVAAGYIGARVTVEPTPVGASPVQIWNPAPDFRASGTLKTEFVYFPLSRTDIRPAWRVSLPEIGVGNDYDLIVDASDGQLLWRRNRLQFAVSPYPARGGTQDISLRVYTLDSPAPGSPGTSTPTGFQFPTVPRTLVTVTPASVPESPNSWIDDGVNETIGNNVDGHTDLDADDLPDLPRPTGSPFRIFDFPQDNAQAPSAWPDAAATNLFYFCNRYHDRIYGLGFDEAAGNFQQDNFGRGGLGGDRVLADAQDGGGTANANFFTPDDGESGRMQQYVFAGPRPDRDSSLDSDIVYHEYSHGVSNRLHDLELSGAQAGGMGEGWGDFFGVSLNAEPTDDPNLCYSIGAYTTYELSPGFVDNYYFGIRRFPYSTDFDKNPTTYADTDPAQQSYPPGVPRNPYIPNAAAEVHNVGAIWTNMLLEIRAAMWARLGFAANQRLMQLVVDGMKLDPGTPNFLQARDAILLADLVRYGGADLDDLWTGFSKRGCGWSATSPDGSTSLGVVEDFRAPIFFAYPSGIPRELQPNRATTFEVEISGYGPMEPSPGSGRLFLSVNGGPFTSSALAETSPNHYAVSLPDSACLDELRFYVATRTTGGSDTDPTGAPAQFHTASVTTSFASVLDDDFETNQGWTSTSSGATSGFWQRGVPVDDPAWPFGPLGDGDGSGRCYVTGNQAGNSDVDGGSVTLTSPVLDMRGGADIAYDYYLVLENDTAHLDRMLVEIDSHGGAGPWTTIASHATSGGQAWRENTITALTLSSLGVAFTANMRVRFTATDANPQSVVEAGIDGFHVHRKLCDEGPAIPLCAGDGSAIACPCSNGGNTGNGCDNAESTGGAHLSATGTTSPDTVALAVTGERSSALTVFFQGDASIAPVLYGDGIRCVGGSLKRLYSKNASAGQAVAPTGAEPSVTARSAALGDPISPGSTRRYYTAYRDPSPSFCPAPTGSTFNSSNALSIVW